MRRKQTAWTRGATFAPKKRLRFWRFDRSRAVSNPGKPTKRRQCDDKHSHNDYPFDQTAVLIRIESPANCFDPIWPKRAKDIQNPCRTARNDLRRKPKRKVSNLERKRRGLFFTAPDLAQRQFREPLRLPLRRPVEEPRKLAEDGGSVGFSVRCKPRLVAWHGQGAHR